MVQRVLSSIGLRSKRYVAAALPCLLVLVAVLGVTYVVVILSVESMRDPLQLALFSALMAMHGILHGFSLHLRESAGKDRWSWLAAYLAAQGLLLLSMSALTQSQGLIIGLYIALAGGSVAIVWPNTRATGLVVLACLGLFALNGIFVWDIGVLPSILPLVALLAAFAFVCALLYFRQIQARESVSLLRQELELTRQRLQSHATLVQDLSLAQERQDAALEPHDALAQHLTALILQLEAAGSGLEDSQPEQAETELEQALGQARAALEAADRAGQALRSSTLEPGSLFNALIEQVDQFTSTTGIQASLEVDDLKVEVPPETSHGILRIVQESLNNVARHAGANQVNVQVLTSEEELKVVVQDDGVGFDVAESMLRPECHGLAGMQDRARSMQGHLRLESIPGSGTRLVLTLYGRLGGGAPT